MYSLNIVSTKTSFWNEFYQISFIEYKNLYDGSRFARRYSYPNSEESLDISIREYTFVESRI